MLSITRSLLPSRLNSQRLLRTSATTQAIENSPLFKLRQKTGLSYTLCREALNKHDNNVDESVAWLRAHALAHGIQKASKFRDRTTREGLVCLSVAKNSRLTTVVELNCETDFVARNQIFKDFAIDITKQISADQKNCTSFRVPEGKDFIDGLRPKDEFLSGLQNQIAPFISRLGENIRLARAFHLQVNDPNIRLFGQIHAQAAKKSSESFDITAGRFGAIVALRLEEEADLDDDKLRMYGNRLCQHVIGFSPSYIELPENIRKHLEAAEKEKLLNNPESVENEEENTDEDVTSSSHNSRDDWPSIMDQTLIMTDDLPVREFCKNNKFSILYFDRIECGIES